MPGATEATAAASASSTSLKTGSISPMSDTVVIA